MDRQHWSKTRDVPGALSRRIQRCFHGAIKESRLTGQPCSAAEGPSLSDPASVDSPPPSILIAWAQLIRLPNVFTILADTAAAFLLVAHGPKPIGRFVAVILAGVCLYWAGMILNDVYDVEKDRRERSSRPLASGAVSIGTARIVGYMLLLLGIVVAFASGYVPSDVYDSTWLPGAIAIGIAICVVAYDGPLKRTPLAPGLMGGCRVLSFLMGAAPVLMTSMPSEIPKYLLATALGMGIYVMGLTLFGKKEAAGGRGNHLPTGTLLAGLGTILLAFAPQLSQVPQPWHVSTRIAFPVLIGLIAFPVVLRAIRATQNPTPMKIQMTMRIGILTIIPLAAAFALLGAGPLWGVTLFAMVIPSLLLAAKLRVT